MNITMIPTRATRVPSFPVLGSFDGFGSCDSGVDFWEPYTLSTLASEP